MPMLPPIRTITLGIAEPHPLTASVIEHAKTILQHARVRYSEAGYEVQSVRLSTQPIFTNLASWSVSAILAYAKELQSFLDTAGLQYCSLGPAQVTHPGFPLDRLDLIVDILARSRAFSTTVQLATLEHGLRQDAAMPTARIIQQLAQEIPNGDGNFRFAMLACVAPGCPFFPAAYHAGPGSLSIGLQGASIIRETLLGHEAEMSIGLEMRQVTQWLCDALNEWVAPIVVLGQQLAQEYNLLFGGIDLSPAPMGEDSIVPALETLCWWSAGYPWHTGLCSGYNSGVEKYYIADMWLLWADAARAGGCDVGTALGRGLCQCPSTAILFICLWHWTRYHSACRKSFCWRNSASLTRCCYTRPPSAKTTLRSSISCNGETNWRAYNIYITLFDEYTHQIGLEALYAPKGIHHAIIGTFDTFVETRIFNCQRS